MGVTNHREQLMNKRLTFGAFALVFAFSSTSLFAEGAVILLSRDATRHLCG